MRLKFRVRISTRTRIINFPNGGLEYPRWRGGWWGGGGGGRGGGGALLLSVYIIH